MYHRSCPVFRNSLIVAVLLLMLCICFSCRQDRNNLIPDNMPTSVLVNSVKSSDDNPVPLCGEGDLQYFINLLECYKGGKVYESFAKAMESMDTKFKHTTDKGYSVKKFDVRCGRQTFEIYVTTDACDNLSEYEEYNIEEHRFTEEDYSNKPREYERIDSYDEISEPFETIEADDNDEDSDNESDNVK